MIEGSNIEYGKIENCNIDTNLTSKIWRLVTSKKNDGNVENSIENGKIEMVTSNLSSTYLTFNMRNSDCESRSVNVHNGEPTLLIHSLC